MVNRPAGGARSKRYEREPLDWYCEDARPVDQLFARFDFGSDLIYDPCCGRGNILDVARRHGHETVGSDLEERWLVGLRHRFMRGDALLIDRPPKLYGRGLSVISNPPYSYIEDIAELIIRRVLDYLPVNQACFLLPIAFLASDQRWKFFERDFKPSHVAICSERPSMPPGSTVDQTTEFKGGMADYIWLVFRPPHRWRTETVWLQPKSIRL